jgi:hypothetical protein
MWAEPDPLWEQDEEEEGEGEAGGLELRAAAVAAWDVPEGVGWLVRATVPVAGTHTHARACAHLP